MRPPLTIVLVLLALLGSAASALASGQDVLDDCTDDEIMQRTYTQAEYRAALRELAADADQYGNCREVIRRAQLAALADRGGSRGRTGDAGSSGGGSGRSGGTTGGSGAVGSRPADEQLSTATAGERAALDAARANSAPAALERIAVDPTKVGSVPGLSQVSALPTPLAVLLALLLAGALALAGLRLLRLVHARRA